VKQAIVNSRLSRVLHQNAVSARECSGVSSSLQVPLRQCPLRDVYPDCPRADEHGRDSGDDHHSIPPVAAEELDFL
jgi:hypothetical protein